MGQPTTAKCVSDAIAREIANSTPSIEPNRRFVLYRGENDLNGQAKIQGEEKQRFFVVYPEPDNQYGRWSGKVANVRQTFVVEIRYVVPSQRGGIQRAREMFGEDNMHIAGIITGPRPSKQLARQIVDSRSVRNPRLQSKGQGVYVGRLELFTQYFYRRP